MTLTRSLVTLYTLAIGLQVLFVYLALLGTSHSHLPCSVERKFFSENKCFCQNSHRILTANCILLCTIPKNPSHGQPAVHTH